MRLTYKPIILPMEKNATQLLSNKQKQAVCEKPKESTIRFLQQFARVYSFNKEMPLQLGSFIAN